MFQKLGLKDIFREVWYRKFMIIAIAIVAVLVSLLDVFVIRDTKIEETQSQTIYTKSILISVDALEKSEFYDNFSQSQKVRNNYVVACQTEFFANYLIKNIQTELPLSEYFIQIDGVETGVNLRDKNVTMLLQSFSIERPNDSTAIKLTFECYDNVIGDKVIDLVIPFMQQEMQSKLGEANFTELGRYSYENISESTSSESNILKPLIKDLLIFGFGLEALYMLAVLLKVVLMPAIHEKNDIKAYFDVPVWETK